MAQPAFYGLMAGVLQVDIAYLQVLMRFPALHLPLHVDHVSERFGLIIIIFLGESIVGLGLQVSSAASELHCRWRPAHSAACHDVPLRPAPTAACGAHERGSARILAGVGCCCSA